MKPSKIVILEPGDKLIIKLKDTVIGKMTASLMSSEINYDDVVDSLIGKRRSSPKEERFKTPETKMSRQIQLLIRALSTGKWTSGAPIDKGVITLKLKLLLSLMTPYDAAKLTIAAKDSLQSIVLPPDVTKMVQNLFPV